MDKELSRSEWDEFSRTGLIIREQVLDQHEIEELIQAIDRQPAFAQWSAVEKDPQFADLIDHEEHFWIIYDIFGEASKLTRSEYFCRDPGSIQRNRWHFDGPRNLTFQAYRALLPFRVKVAYWLTDLTSENMDNFTFIPGSHREDVFDGYHTHEPYPEEVHVVVPAGSMPIMWGGLWHRVAPNESEVVRKNVFLEYGPSWLVSGDQIGCDPEWLGTRTRRQRILMRDYSSSPNDYIKIPKNDIPRVSLEDIKAREGTLPHTYGQEVPLHLRKFPTRAESWASHDG